MNHENPWAVVAVVIGSTGMVLSLAAAGFAQDGIPSIPDDKQFAQQNVSPALVRKIPRGLQACTELANKKLISRNNYCSYRRKYVFKDATAIAEKQDTAYVSIAFIPKSPLSQAQALSYAQALDHSGKMAFNRPQSQANKTTYSGCSFNTGSKDIFLCRAELNLTPNGSVAKIFVIHESP